MKTKEQIKDDITYYDYITRINERLNYYLREKANLGIVIPKEEFEKYNPFLGENYRECFVELLEENGYWD